MVGLSVIICHYLSAQNSGSIFQNSGSIFPNGVRIFPNGGSIFQNGGGIFLRSRMKHEWIMGFREGIVGEWWVI